MKNQLFMGIPLLALFATFALATSSVTTYQVPPKEIVALADAAPEPETRLSPDRKRVLLLMEKPMATIAELAREQLKLAGLRFDPASFASTRVDDYSEISFQDVAGGKVRPLKNLPQGRILAPVWSPSGAWVAFGLEGENGIALWVADAGDGATRALTPSILNMTLIQGFSWTPDSSALICVLRPQNHGPRPKQAVLPIGPNIQESTGSKAAIRTYQDMLQNAHDEETFAYFTSGQIARVSLKGEITRLGEPAMMMGLAPSPDGSQLLVTTLHPPFSYLVPFRRFPQRIEVWNLAGETVFRLADLPLADTIPKGFDAVRQGARNVRWRADKPTTLVWAEAQDGGDPAQKADIRDKVFQLDAPYAQQPVVLASIGTRFRGIQWGNDQLALLTENWWRSREQRTWVIQPGMAAAQPRLLFARSSEDRYADPGNPILRRGPLGTRVLHTLDNNSALLYSGKGASPEGDVPFLDKRILSDWTAQRLWQSEAPYYEEVEAVLDNTGKRLLTIRETKLEPPNIFVRDLTTAELRALTKFEHPAPEMIGVQKELIKYLREDGVQLTATLYLPSGYKKEDGPLPMIMWAYPREFKNAKAAGQVRSSPYRFVRLSAWGPLPYLTQGYAVLARAAMPIIGVGDTEPNDHFREQLVSSARAAIDEVVGRGLVDRKRIAIGGHSYGAFMVANLLAHSDLFQAGIARSGAYNRTLTPFGFQREERTFWEAADVYGTMSPFFHAEKINEPLLLIHGEQDNNSGTFPIQSKRMYQAIKGLGGTVRLVMLPLESHGYRARASRLHMLWEQLQWLERHVKQPKPAEKNPS